MRVYSWLKENKLGTGSDNEPLIKDVVVLSEITDMFYKKNNDKEEI